MIRTLAVKWAAIVVCSNNDGKTAAETASYEMVIGEVQGSCQFTLLASTKWNSVRKPDYELTPECSFSFRLASLHDQPLSASSPLQLKGEVTLSHPHSCKLTNWWIESQHPVSHPSSASKYSSTLAPLRLPSSLHHGLQVHFQIRSITTCKCISKVTRSLPRSVSLSAFDRQFLAHLESLSSGVCSQSRYTVCRSVAIYIHRWKYKQNTWVLTIVEQYVVAMIFRCTSSVPKEAVAFPRLLFNDSRCSPTCCQRS